MESTFFTKKHERLTRIASLANILAWLVLIIYSLAAIINFNGNRSILLAMGLPPDAMTSMDYVRFVINMLRMIVQGAMLWVVLKGIHLGLMMIVETDLNYREQKLGEETHG